VEPLYVVELINLFLRLGFWSEPLVLPLLLLVVSKLRNSFLRRHHGRIVGGFEFSVGEHVHLISHPSLDFFELGLLDELGEGVDLLLVEQGDEVVAEPAHLTVPVQEKLLYEPFLAHLLLVIHPLKSLKLGWSLGKSPFARLLLENQHHESTLFLTFRLFRAAVEKYWNLVNLQHDVGEEELMPILRLLV